MEHNAVVRPLRRLEAGGVSVEVLQCDGEGFLHPSTLAKTLKESHISLVALSHCSNVCGTVQDVETLAGICREAGVPFVLDCAQTAGILPLDAEKLGLAALCFTGHKGLFGPQGIGGILWKPDFAEKTEWFVEGGTGSFSHLELQPDTMPDKFEAGTPNLPGIAGLLAALDWMGETGIENIRRREESLGALLLEGLLSLPGVRFSGRKTMDGRLPVFAVNFEGGTTAFSPPGSPTSGHRDPAGAALRPPGPQNPRNIPRRGPAPQPGVVHHRGRGPENGGRPEGGACIMNCGGGAEMRLTELSTTSG